MNKESQLQQAEWYSLSLKLRNNCRKLRSITPSLSNKRAFLGKLILVGLVIAVLALGTSIYFKMRNGGVEIGAGNVVLNVDYNFSVHNESAADVPLNVSEESGPRIVEVIEETTTQ